MAAALPGAAEFGIAYLQFDPAGLGVDVDAVAGLNGRDGAARRRFRGNVADAETPRAAGETAVGDQRARMPAPTIAAVGESISCMPGPPRGPS